MFKQPTMILAALLSVSFYSCSELGAKRTESAKTEANDDSFVATTGGLELTQPKLDQYVPAKFYQITLSHAKCSRDGKPDLDEKPIHDEAIIDVGAPDLPKQGVNLEGSQSSDRPKEEVGELDKGKQDSPIPPRHCELKPIHVIKVPYVAGKLIRLKAPDGRLHVKIRILDGHISLLEGESIVQVLGGQGQTNVALYPTGQQPGLIITTTVEGEVKPPPPPEPQNPYPEIKDYLKYPGSFITRIAKPGMQVITVTKHRAVADVAPEIVAAQPSDGIALADIKTIDKKHGPFTQVSYHFNVSKPGKYIVRVIDLRGYEDREAYLPAIQPNRTFYHVIKVE